MTVLLICFLALPANLVFAQNNGDDVAGLLREARESGRGGDAAGRSRAAQLYRQALVLLEGNRVETARVSLEMGDLSTAEGHLDVGRSWFERALADYQVAGNLPGQAAALNSLGSTVLTLGRIDEALSFYARARGIWEAAGNRRGVAQTHSNEALAMRHAGELRRALDSNRVAIELARAARDEVLEATTLHNTAEVLVDIGEYEEALRVGELALRLHRRVGPVGGEIHTMIHLAEASVGKGDIAQARKYLDTAEARAQQQGANLMQAYILRESARVHASFGRATEAVTRYERALGLLPTQGFPRMEAEIRLRLGQAARALGRAEQAWREWIRSMELARQIENPLLEAEAQAALAGADRDAGRLEQAAERAEAATFLVEAQRTKLSNAAQRASYTAVRRELYSVTAGIHMRLGRVAAAFDVSERAHARALLDLLTHPAQRLAAGMEGSPGTAAGLGPGLDADTLVIEYLLGEDESFAFTLDHKSLRAFRLPRRAVIEDAVRQARSAMAEPGLRGLGRFVEASTACYRMLIGVTGGLPRAKSRLIVIPDGILHALPFEALVAREAPSYRELRYVVKTHTVSYAPSLSVLAGLRGPATGAGTAGGMALAALALSAAMPGLGALPYAEPEARAIAAVFGQDQTILLTGEKATEAALRRPEVRQARRIHFATHGLTDARPGKMGLALARGAEPGDNGILHAEEVARMELAAELVVLSGCDTGLGRQLAGEGTLGLTRSFHVAGVPAVVSSLWKVADHSSADLMTSFYRGLVGGAASRPATALRNAKLAMIRRPEWAHPYYWAAFVLSGR